jgi:hypothetical protein
MNVQDYLFFAAAEVLYSAANWRDEYDMSDPNQREAARCLQASLVREKWPELFY